MPPSQTQASADHAGEPTDAGLTTAMRAATSSASESTKNSLTEASRSAKYRSTPSIEINR